MNPTILHSKTEFHLREKVSMQSSFEEDGEDFRGLAQLLYECYRGLREVLLMDICGG